MTKLGWAVLILLVGCRGPIADPVTADLSVSPLELDFGRVAIGVSLPLTLELRNGGRAPSNPLALAVEGPFLVSPSEVTLGGGTIEPITVTFVPTSTGALTGVLHLGEGLPDVPLHGEGLPACQSNEPCRAPRFELSTRECVTDARPEGAACQAPCLRSDGVCRGGYCTGAEFSSCADTDACTLDACTSEGACVHPVIDCTVTDPCLATYCDPVSGCATTPVTDGAPCGEVTCETAFICLGGRCQERTKPNALSECRYTAIAAGTDHTCVVTVGGELRCWGANAADQQGRGFPSVVSAPALVPGVQGVRSVAAPPGNTTWASLASGQVIRLNDALQLPLDAARVAAGLGSELCGIEQGVVRCASAADGGLLEDVTTSAADLSMGRDQLCVAFLDGGLSCGSRQALAVVPLPGPTSTISAGARDGGCALIGDGAYCWGPMFSGGPRFAWDGGVQAVAAHRWQPGACAGTSRGVECVGGDFSWPSLDPRPGPLPSPVAELALGFLHGCALLRDGRVTCWGQNQQGQLGNRSSQPVGVQQALTGVDWLGQYTGAFGSIGGEVLFSTGGGVQTLGSLRVTEDVDAGLQWMTPYAVPVEGTVAGYERGCPCTSDGGTSWCGRDLPLVPLGELGVCGSVRQGLCTTTDAGVRCFGALSDGGALGFDAWDGGAAITALVGEPRGDGLCAVRTDGQLDCQGLAAVNVPAQSLSAVNQLCFGQASAGGCALLEGGALRCWGDWVGSAVPRLPLGAWSLVRQVTCGARHFCALSGNSIVQCWGDNEFGQLGLDGPSSTRAFGIPMPERVVNLAAGARHTCALLQSGKVLCWGSNFYGELGQPILVQSKAPVLMAQ